MISSTDGAYRHGYKRLLGISATREDGSVADALTDATSKGFEDYVAKLLGVPPDDRILARGRAGPPFAIDVDGRRLTVKPYLMMGKSDQYLIIEPDKPHRQADLYVVGKRVTRGGPYKVLGWTDHNHLAAGPKLDFGHGRKLARHRRDLYPMDTFPAAVRTGTALTGQLALALV